MTKKINQMSVRYRSLADGADAALKCESSLDKILSHGNYAVEIDHTATQAGLPVEYCGSKHYIVGTLVVTDCGTMQSAQDNRVIGQVLIITLRDERETKIFTRTLASGEWSPWRTMAQTGMYDKIANDDELYATVTSLVSTTKETEESLRSSIINYNEWKATNAELSLPNVLADAELVKLVKSGTILTFKNTSTTWKRFQYTAASTATANVKNYSNWKELSAATYSIKQAVDANKVQISTTGENGGVKDILNISAATTERAGVMSAEDKNVLNKIAVIPNNNNYIKNWETGNKLVTRLYVENKELAIADKLYIRQVFYKLNKDTNCGFNFGNTNAGWATVIAPNIGAFDVYETTNYTCDGIKAKYGKIAIRINWNAVEWATAVQVIGVQAESNLNDIVFDWNEFVKPLEPGAKILENSISENELTDELKGKINSPAPFLSNYELFSLGDSLSSGGIWQAKVAEKTGCNFDQTKNVKSGAMLSVGGTSSFGNSFDNVLWRTKNLIDQGYITGEGENAIVILENVNDGYKLFDGNAKSIIPATPIEGYSLDRFTSEGSTFLEEIADKAALNAVLRLTKSMPGKNLKIETLPTKEGDVTLYIGWAGPGRSYYNIHLVPQATDEDTLQYVLDKILEYSYTGITDVIGDDGVSVDFSNGQSSTSYPVTVEFSDTDGTGMTVTITDNPNAKTSVAMYFTGDSTEEWTDTSKWQEGITYSQGWKSSIEMLQRAYPKLHIFVSLFPLHSVTASEYLLPSGAYDSVSYNGERRMEIMRNMQVELAKIAEFYSLPFLNVFAECGIGINNMLTFYHASANVHPKPIGYERFGETVASQLSRYLV